jgi:hypothetical protein
MVYVKMILQKSVHQLNPINHSSDVAHGGELKVETKEGNMQRFLFNCQLLKSNE